MVLGMNAVRGNIASLLVVRTDLGEAPARPIHYYAAT